MSQVQFRVLVIKSVENKAMDYLNTIELSHSKSKPLIKQIFFREKYFLDERFSKSEIELILALRTRMISDVKNNFSTRYGNNLACDLCHVQICSQEHLLNCTELGKHVEVPKYIEYSDIFKSTDKQLKIVKVFKKLLRVREMLKNK